MDPNIEEIRNEIRKRMKEKNLTVEEWAQSQGISEGVASKTLSRCLGKKKRPTSWRSKEIIEGLEELTGLKLCG